MSHPNAQVIERFYGALNARDGATMAALYAPGASFEDPAFGPLDGAAAGDMWRMLTDGEGDLRVELSEVEADAAAGSAHWIAHYTFTPSGRPVVNDIRAAFVFTPDGLIAEHRDRFSFHAWSRQALGLPGLLFGWTPLLQRAVRKKALAQLAAFRAGRG